MGMSGKTFLSAFQMGSRMYPDIVKSRADEVDRKAKRKVINLQKKKLKEEATIAKAARERKVISQTGYDGFTTGYKALETSDPKYYDKYAALVEEFIVPMSMNEDIHKMYSVIDAEVKDAAGYKADVVNRNNTLLAINKWNEENYLDQVSSNPSELAPEKKKEVNDFFKKHLQEEKNKVTRADVEAAADAQSGVEDKAKFKAFAEETGSPYKAGDYVKPEAKNAMRIHNQLGEVKELLMEVGEEGLPIASKLAIRSDGSGYKNLLEVKTKLVTLNNKLKEQRGSKGKSLSEAQGNAFAYSERMRANNRVIDQMEVQGLVPENDILNELLVAWGSEDKTDFWNVIVDPEYQQFKSAADNFIRATLRKESGAAISESEYRGAFRDYIPRIGDSPGLVKQKRRLRIGVANVMRRQSGMAWDSGDEFPLAPFQFNDLEQAKKYAALGYVEDGDEVLIKSGDSWATHKLNSKKKTIATP